MRRCFPTRDSSTRKFFPAGHCSRRTVSAALFTTEFCLPTVSATYVAGNIGRHLIWTRMASSPFLLLLLPAGGIVLPRCCDSCAVFCTFFSVANTLSNAVLVFIVLTCACQITGVILLSLFSFTLLLVVSATGEIFTAAAVASLSFGVHQRNLAGTLLRGKFGSLHVLFLCVHSILVFMTSQCPICGVDVLTLCVEKVVERAASTVALAKVLQCAPFVFKESPVHPTDS